MRYASGTLPTKYQFTGQYSDSYINLLWYGSRHYDPELGRFISPDSIVPTSVQGVQAYDRYAYANNAPTRYTDPTGHMIDDGYVGNHRRLDCQKYGQYCNNGKPKSSAELLAMRRPPRPEPPKAKGAPPQGSIYTQLSVILNSEFQNAQLGTKAQENHTGWGGSGTGDMPFIYDLVDAITGVSSDFSNSSAGLYPIGIRIDWHGNESGVSIDNVQVSNYSPTNVYLDGIHLRTDPLGANDIIVQGPADGVGINGDQPGVINMSVNTTLPSQDTVMTVQITTYGGFSPHPYVRIAFPAGAFPPGGCSVLNP